MQTLEDLINEHAFKLHILRGDKHTERWEYYTPIAIFPEECNCLSEARLMVERILDRQDAELLALFKPRQV